MSKVYGIHTLEVKANSNVQEFVQYCHDELAGLGVPGLQFHLLKCDRSSHDETVGDYRILVECDSVETHDRLFPVAGGGSEIVGQQVDALFAALQRTGIVLSNFTDLVTIV